MLHPAYSEDFYLDYHDPTGASNVTLPHRALRTVVGAVCSLSMGGALLIIFSYVFIKSIRTKAREILVHLSVADFGVACSNFIGVTVYFDHYIRKCDNQRNGSTVGFAVSCTSLKNLCTAQAFFAAYSTLASVLWTLCLSVYIYTLIVHHKRRLHTKVVYFSYFFCWGMPLLVTLWLVGTDRLGYSPYGGSGWCSLKLDHVRREELIFLVIFANDLWIYLTFVVVTVLYFTTHCYLRYQIQEAYSLLMSGSNRSTLHTADTKFLLIPTVFLLLRIWSVGFMFLLVYLRVHLSKIVIYVLLYATGIGDSGQGFVNALLFCLFTPKVREKLYCCRRGNQCCPSQNSCSCWRQRQYINLQQSSSGQNLVGGVTTTKIVSS